MHIGNQHLAFFSLQHLAFFTSDFQNLAFLRQTSFDGRTAKFKHFEKEVAKLFPGHKNTSKKRGASSIRRCDFVFSSYRLPPVVLKIFLGLGTCKSDIWALIIDIGP